MQIQKKKELTLKRNSTYKSSEKIFNLLTSFSKMEKLTWEFSCILNMGKFEKACLVLNEDAHG
jgi:hypothetical protein